MRRAYLASAALGFLFGAAACGPRFVETDRKVVILGFDGVDPDLVRQYLDEPTVLRIGLPIPADFDGRPLY